MRELLAVAACILIGLGIAFAISSASSDDPFGDEKRRILVLTREQSRLDRDPNAAGTSLTFYINGEIWEAKK